MISSAMTMCGGFIWAKALVFNWTAIVNPELRCFVAQAPLYTSLLAPNSGSTLFVQARLECLDICFFP